MILMSAGGPLTNFTDAEKLEFKPIYTKYISKEFGPKEIFVALGRNKEKYDRFQGYASIMTNLLVMRQAEKKVEVKIEGRDLLVKQVADREAAIAASRAKSAGAAAQHTPSVRVSPTKS